MKPDHYNKDCDQIEDIKGSYYQNTVLNWYKIIGSNKDMKEKFKCNNENYKYSKTAEIQYQFYGKIKIKFYKREGFKFNTVFNEKLTGEYFPTDVCPD